MAAYEFTVVVRTQYLAEQSDPDRSNYVFAYTITIKNTGAGRGPADFAPLDHHRCQ